MQVYNFLLIRSVGKKNRQLSFGKHATGHPAEHHLQQLGMRIGAHDQQIRSRPYSMSLKGPGYIAMLCWKIGNRHVLTMSRKVSCQSCTGDAFCNIGDDADNFDPFGASKQRYGIPNSPSRPGATIPANYDILKLCTFLPVRRDDENRPPGREQHRLDQISVQGKAIHRPRDNDNVVRSRCHGKAAIRVCVGLLHGLKLDGYTRNRCGARYSLFSFLGMYAPLSIDLINECVSERNKSGDWDPKIWRSHED